MPAYATAEDYARYCPGGSLSGAELDAALERASRQADAYCFGRIRAIGFDRLTALQQDCIRQAVCLHAEFLARYGDELESPLQSYGINGVSMTFDATRVSSQGGVTTCSEAASLLMQTGLAHRGIW